MKAKGVEVQKAYTPRKSAKISYRRAIVEVIVMSPMDNFNLASELAIRGVAVRKGLLPKLWGEDSLVQENAMEAPTKEVDEQLFVAAKATRQVLRDSLSEEDLSADSLEMILKGKRNVLNSDDRHSRVEVAF